MSRLSESEKQKIRSEIRKHCPTIKLAQPKNVSLEQMLRLAQQNNPEGFNPRIK